MSFTNIEKLNLKSIIDSDDIINANKSTFKKTGASYSKASVPNGFISSVNYEISHKAYNIGKADIRDAFIGASKEISSRYK